MVTAWPPHYGGDMTDWTPSEGVVRLPNDRLIRGTGIRRPRGQAQRPDFAIYLLDRDPCVGAWPNRWVRWRDFRLPDSTDDALEALREAHTRALSERVEIACKGGIGRTGTAIAILAVMSGVLADDAVDWVRAHYHPRAVETRGQRAWIASVAAQMA